MSIVYTLILTSCLMGDDCLTRAEASFTRMSDCIAAAATYTDDANIEEIACVADPTDW